MAAINHTDPAKSGAKTWRIAASDTMTGVRELMRAASAVTSDTGNGPSVRRVLHDAQKIIEGARPLLVRGRADDYFGQCVDPVSSMLNCARHVPDSGVGVPPLLGQAADRLDSLAAVLDAASLLDGAAPGDTGRAALKNADADKTAGAGIFASMALALLEQFTATVREAHAGNVEAMASAEVLLSKLAEALKAAEGADTPHDCEAALLVADGAIGELSAAWDTIDTPLLWALYYGTGEAIKNGIAWGRPVKGSALTALEGEQGERAHLIRECATEVSQSAAWLLTYATREGVAHSRPFLQLLRRVRVLGDAILFACDDDMARAPSIRSLLGN